MDEERVTRLLDRILGDFAELRLLAERGDEALLGDETALGAVKYGFVVSIEGSARVARHIVVSEGWSAPESNADASESNVWSRCRGPRSRAMLRVSGGLRKVLVHEHVDVDDRIVVENLGRLADFEDFVADVAAWLRDRRPED